MKTENSHKRIIVVTGTPGVGKTTVSKALAAKLEASLIGIANLVKEENLVSGIDDERKTLIADIRKISKRIKEVVGRIPGDIIIEGHYAQYVVPSNLVSHVIVLRRDPEELEAEFEARGYNDRKIVENVSSEVLDVCLAEAVKKYSVGKVWEIDVSKKTIDKIVEEILEILADKMKPRQETIDWLRKLDREGRLDEILSLLGRT